MIVEYDQSSSSLSLEYLQKKYSRQNLQKDYVAYRKYRAQKFVNAVSICLLTIFCLLISVCTVLSGLTLAGVIDIGKALNPLLVFFLAFAALGFVLLLDKSSHRSWAQRMVYPFFVYKRMKNPFVLRVQEGKEKVQIDICLFDKQGLSIWNHDFWKENADALIEEIVSCRSLVDEANRFYLQRNQNDKDLSARIQNALYR